MTKEIWKELKGFEGVYEVSNLGRVKRLAYKKRIGNGAYQPCAERILKPSDDMHGYLKCEVYYNNKRTCLKVHRLIAIHFIPNPENKPCINHIDGNSRNNSIDNLEWCTYQENNHHKYKVLNYKRIMPTGAAHPNSKTVYSMDKNGTIERYDCISDAEKATGLFNSNIVKTLKGKHKSCGGKKWFYDEPLAIKPKHKIIEYRAAS